MPQSDAQSSTSKPAVQSAVPGAVPSNAPSNESQEDGGPASAAEPPSRVDVSSNQALPNQALPSQPLPSEGSPSLGVPAAMLSGASLEERVKDLRKQVERLVKSPGAPLKSAPFHTASTLQSLPPGTEVLILISTPYWYGIETHEGQHGWIMRDQLEQP